MDLHKQYEKVGATYVALLGGTKLHEHSKWLEDNTSIFQWEIWATQKALKWIEKLKIQSVIRIDKLTVL